MDQKSKYIIDDLKVNPVQMPSEDYFEALKTNILNQIDNNVPIAIGMEQNGHAKIIPLYKRWYVWSSAAAILLFAILFSWNNPNAADESTTINLSSVSDEEIYEYLNQHIEDIDPETIAVHLNSDKLAQNDQQVIREVTKKSSNQSVSNPTLFENIKDEEILDYLKEDSGELDEYLLIES
ncbi:hypothetical protein [Fluviicola sp.]|uniref:hypothetical protein n=1 Tax=Fluviicola sp. TaxID=1917219 RepID=UPI00261972CB|nr:hypothetical protein [Fluviicola sp.]